MSSTWVVVAESSRARIFEMTNHHPPLLELMDMMHSDSRLRGQDLISDRAGRSFDSRGQGRHGMEVETDIKQKESMDFARSIAQHVDAERKNGKFDRLILVAPPRFLGLLRDNLSDITRKQIVNEVDKNLVQQDPETIQGQIRFA